MIVTCLRKRRDATIQTIKRLVHGGQTLLSAIRVLRHLAFQCLEARDGLTGQGRLVLLQGGQRRHDSVIQLAVQGAELLTQCITQFAQALIALLLELGHGTFELADTRAELIALIAPEGLQVMQLPLLPAHHAPQGDEAKPRRPASGRGGTGVMHAKRIVGTRDQRIVR